MGSRIPAPLRTAVHDRRGAPTLAANAPLAPPLAISPDGSRFAARTAAGTVGIFSVRTLQPQASVTIPRAATITALAWSPVGSELAVGGDDDLLQLWDVSGAPHVVRTLTMASPIRHVPGAIQSVAFSADGRLIAASDVSNSPATFAANGRIAIWQTRTGTPITRAFQHGTFANAVAFSPDDRLLAVATGTAAILILDSSNGTQLRTIHSLRATTAAPSASPSPQTARSRREPTPALFNCGTRPPVLPSGIPCSPRRRPSPVSRLTPPGNASRRPADPEAD